MKGRNKKQEKTFADNHIAIRKILDCKEASQGLLRSEIKKKTGILTNKTLRKHLKQFKEDGLVKEKDRFLFWGHRYDWFMAQEKARNIEAHLNFIQTHLDLIKTELNTNAKKERQESKKEIESFLASLPNLQEPIFVHEDTQEDLDQIKNYFNELEKALVAFAAVFDSFKLTDQKDF
jgi:DNA-binding HxlR family transcriptional regulator